MPIDDFITTSSPLNLTVNPSLSVLNGMIMLCHSGSCPGCFESLPLTDEQTEEIELIFNGLYHAVIPQKAFPDFPSYLKYMEECDPFELRRNIFHFYKMKHDWKSGTLKEETEEAVTEKVLESSDSFIGFLSEGFDRAHFSESVERKAYELLINPEEMRKRIAGLLKSLWTSHFRSRWESVRDDLSDFVKKRDIGYIRRFSKAEAIAHITGIDIPAEKMQFILRDERPIHFVPTFDVKNGYSKMVSAGILYIFFNPDQFEKRRLDAQLSSIDDLSGKLGALADPNRLNILKYIKGKGEACSQDILKDMGFSQSAVSRHLKLLSDSGILKERRQMSAKYYRVNGEYTKNILSSIETFLGI